MTKTTLQIEPSDMEGTIKQAKRKLKTKVETAQKRIIIDTRTKGRIHEQTDEEPVQHYLQSMHENAECEEQLQEQPPKHRMQNVQKCDRNTTAYTRRMPTNLQG